MLNKTNIKFENVTHCSISLLWEIDARISLSHILLKLKKHSTPPEDLGTLRISPSAIGFDLISLSPSTLYEIQVAPCDNSRQFSWSNILVCMTLKPPVHDLYYPSEQHISDLRLGSKEILDSRNLKDWKAYVSCGYKFARPKELRTKIIQRTLNWADAVDRLEDHYSLDHSYFQGPFVLRPKTGN